jgi:hypothetical protein
VSPIGEFKHDLFVSHNGADADWVKRLAAHLELEQWKIWIYQWDIQPGERWESSIEAAILTSRKHALVLSPEALESSWIKLEYDSMLDLALSGDRRRFVPLLLKTCNVPLFVAQFQWIDFRDPDQFFSKLNDLQCFLRNQPLPRPIGPSVPASGKVESRDDRKLRAEVHKILTYFNENDVLKGFVCVHLDGISWKQLRGDKIIALIQRYSWPDKEDEGLRTLLQEAEQYLEQLRPR